MASTFKSIAEYLERLNYKNPQTNKYGFIEQNKAI